MVCIVGQVGLVILGSSVFGLASSFVQGRLSFGGCRDPHLWLLLIHFLECPSQSCPDVGGEVYSCQ